MKPKIVKISEKRVIGMKSSMSHGEYGNIVTLWKRFMPRRKELKNILNNPLCILNNANFNIVDVPIKYKPIDILNSCKSSYLS